MAAKKFDKHNRFIVLGSYQVKGARVMEFMKVGTDYWHLYHQKFTPRSGMYDELYSTFYGIEDVGTGKYQEFEADWRYNDGEIEIDVSSWKLTGKVLQVGFTVM